MSVKTQIVYLIQLQEIDTQVARIDGILGNVTARVTELEQQLAGKKAAVSDRISAFEASREGARILEEEIQTCQVRIEKDNIHLRKCASHKEYQVIQRELDETRKRKSGMEDRLLELMAELETAESEYLRLTEEVAKIEKETESRRAEILDETVREREEREKLLEVRKKLAATIDPSILRRYDHILARTRGPAIVPIENGMCFGCFLNIPPQFCIEVQRGEEIRFCPQCHRIIYWRTAEAVESA